MNLGFKELGILECLEWSLVEIFAVHSTYVVVFFAQSLRRTFFPITVPHQSCSRSGHPMRIQTN